MKRSRHRWSQRPVLRDELSEAAAQWRKWWEISLFDVKRQYLFTALGPFWLVGSNLLFVLVLSLLYANAFDISLDFYLPHFGIGYIVWTLMTDNAARGANVFVTEYPQISQIRINLLGLILKGAFARVLIFAANLLVILLLTSFFVDFGWSLLWVVPGIAILALNSFLQSYWTSAASARFRDFPLILSNIMRVGFFLTPILWSADNVQVALRSTLVAFNPFYYLIEIIRAPLQHGEISSQIVIGVLVVTLINCGLFWAVFTRMHNQIVHESA